MSEHRVAAPPTILPDVAPDQEASVVAPRHAPRPTPASTTASGGAGRLLTAGSVLRARPHLAPALRAAGYAVRTVERWDGLFEVIERECIAATLVDLDAANRAARETVEARPAPGAASGAGRALSGDRLVALLARRARDTRFALVVQTALDFAEIEELIHQGIHALVHPQHSDDMVAACIKRLLEGRSPVAAPPATAPAPRVEMAPPVTLEDAAPWPVGEWSADDGRIPPVFG